MTKEQQPYDRVNFELQYEKWIASQITDDQFYDYLNENGIAMGEVLDLANERRRLSEVQPPQSGDDVLKEIGEMSPPPSGNPMSLEQCLKCHAPVALYQAFVGIGPKTWMHVESDLDFDHLPKVLVPMAVNDITGLVEAEKVIVKNSQCRWDALDWAHRYQWLDEARRATDPDYPPKSKFVLGHDEAFRRALDETGGPIEQD